MPFIRMERRPINSTEPTCCRGRQPLQISVYALLGRTLCAPASLVLSSSDILIEKSVLCAVPYEGS